MSQYMFGTGMLFATPVGGGAPLRVGALQDVSLDISFDTKMLYGQQQFAIDVARAKGKIEGKIGTANIDVNAYNQMIFGKTMATGSKKQAVNEAGVIPATPFQITVANGATFYMDLGVTDVLTGLPMTNVPSAPATGQYSVNSATGVYLFNTAQTGKAVLINYLYTDAANGGTVAITNDVMGSVPSFQLVATQLYKGKAFVIVLYSVIASKLSFPLKQDDHTQPDITYSAQDNGTGNIGLISSTSAVGGGA